MTEGAAIDSDERYQLGSLGDLVELLIDGWQVEGLHYADRSAAGGAAGPPAAYFRLQRGPERRGMYVPDDGRAFSHRALVALFRERPEVWKHRSADAVPWPDPPPPPEGGETEEIPEGFPDALALGPASLKSVHVVNQIQSIDGLTIALTVLECHETCARLRYLAHASDARTRRQMRVLDVLVCDDAGHRYQVAVPPPRAEGNRFDGDLLLAPCIARDRSRLTVTVGTVAGEPGTGERVSGPWVFPISLTRRA